MNQFNKQDAGLGFDFVSAPTLAKTFSARSDLRAAIRTTEAIDQTRGFPRHSG
jgi:hypothetical protein